MDTAFLIRHGESRSNAGFATTSPEGIELTPRGREQARRIARLLALCVPIDLIVTSPYLRTKQTAGPTIALPAFRTVAQEEWAVQEFTYLSSMHREHLTSEQRRPRVAQYWEQSEPDYIDSHGSESFVQFIKRVQAFMAKLQAVPYERIAVFSHAQFIGAVLWLIEYAPTEITPQAMREFRMFLDSDSLCNGGIVQLKIHQTQNLWSYEKITDHLTQKGPSFKLQSTAR